TATDCVHCDGVTSDTITVTAECEKAVSSGPPFIAWLIAFWFLGILAFLLRQRDQAEYGRNLYLHLPVRLCRPCQRKFSRRSLAFGLGFIAVVAALIGVVQVAVGLAWGWLMLVGAVVAGWTAARAMQRRRAALKNLLARERIYHQLLQHYPDARLLF